MYSLDTIIQCMLMSEIIIAFCLDIEGASWFGWFVIPVPWGLIDPCLFEECYQLTLHVQQNRSIFLRLRSSMPAMLSLTISMCTVGCDSWFPKHLGPSQMRITRHWARRRDWCYWCSVCQCCDHCFGLKPIPSYWNFACVGEWFYG